MSATFTQAAKDKMVEMIVNRPDPHCIVWARAMASVWGVARDHDLDEPVILTEMVPVRLRRVEDGYGYIEMDRKLSLKATRGGEHIAMRFYFKGGKFFETEVGNVHHINFGETLDMNAC